MAERLLTGIRKALSIAVVLQIAAFGAARADDDEPGSATLRPKSRAATTNAKLAIGADEVEGPTVLEGIPALNGLDTIRDTLRDRYGVYLHGLYLGDPYANLAGGRRPGAAYAGRLDINLDVDASKVAGIPGGTVHANMFEIHGRDLSKAYIGNFLSTNDIAGYPTARLYALWYEQKIGDMLSVRAGQQGIDVEFLTSNYAGNFIDATFGWPGLTSEDLPDGAPAYPLATPAIRVKLDPTRNLSILGAVFDGLPAGPCRGDPQTCDPSGLNFRVSDPPLVFLEGQYRYNRGDDASGLPGTLKLGAFGHFGRFKDQRFDRDGLPLASAASDGVPRRHSPDGGAYGIVDQQIYRLPGDDDAEKGIGVFARVIGAPSDRNPVDLYVDAGMSALGLVPGRPDDLFGVAAALAKISSAASGADADSNAALGIAAPVRNFEAVIEATYQAQIVPGLTIQPTFQYFIHPGGNIADPSGNRLVPIRNAVVLGVTTAIRF